jgi:hypothetical protein
MPKKSGPCKGPNSVVRASVPSEPALVAPPAPEDDPGNLIPQPTLGFPAIHGNPWTNSEAATAPLRRRSRHRNNGLQHTRPKETSLWTIHEEASLARFVDCLCSPVEAVLDRVRQTHGRGLGPDNTQPRKVAKRIYDVIHVEHNIIYDYEPARHWRLAQELRKHSETLRKGTCIDLALLFAALLEGAHLRPVLVRYNINGGAAAHMVSGFWADCHSRFRNGHISRDMLELRRFIASGQLVLVECLGYSQGKRSLNPALNIPFRRAVTVATSQALGRQKKASYSLHFALDVKLCHENGIPVYEQD